MTNPSDDLDDLLDSALDDFEKLDLGCGKRTDECKNGSLKDVENKQEGPSVQGLGLGLPTLRPKKKGKQKVLSGGSTGVDSCISEALDKLTQQTKETIKGLESSAPEDPTEQMMENFAKEFAELSGSQDMESMVETMMHQLLSREILHEPMKEIGGRYPKWLEEHKASLSKEDYERYYHQHQLIVELNDVYENEPNNFTKIVDLMQKMQECGQPPSDIVHELAPDLDRSDFQLEPQVHWGHHYWMK
ncbi:hypothetical protein AMTR_s00106p00092120 [Amborella trichopoda]|uniref:Uncharacterized protein n=1 Tax=Amborella trichopoda TaxID=13333 RepID=W1NYJ9_AMBTC|nr:hypothetical protein AMTR_s00106p00092120 [Amborella trichopoda]